MEKLLSLIQKNIALRFASRFEPEDVIQSVMLSFFGAVADGRHKISPNDDVWKLLQTIAFNKIRNQVKFHNALKRSAGRTVSDPDLLDLLGEPTDQEAVVVADLVEGCGRSG